MVQILKYNTFLNSSWVEEETKTVVTDHWGISDDGNWASPSLWDVAQCRPPGWGCSGPCQPSSPFFLSLSTRLGCLSAMTMPPSNWTRFMTSRLNWPRRFWRRSAPPALIWGIHPPSTGKAQELRVLRVVSQNVIEAPALSEPQGSWEGREVAGPSF